MNKFDIFFSLFCGWTVSFLVKDFLRAGGVTVTFWHIAVLWILLPAVSLFCLWVAYQLGKKYAFFFQMGKHVLVGAFATVVDARFFEFFAAVIFPFPLISKSASFIISMLIKYSGNKFWTFQKHERENWHIELSKFAMIMLVGLTIDVSMFHWLTGFVGAPFGVSEGLWVKSSVVMSALVAAVWNFAGDKFLVFKK